jgi:hypothetical protein
MERSRGLLAMIHLLQCRALLGLILFLADNGFSKKPVLAGAGGAAGKAYAWAGALLTIRHQTHKSGNPRNISLDQTVFIGEVNKSQQWFDARFSCE